MPFVYAGAANAAEWPLTPEANHRAANFSGGAREKPFATLIAFECPNTNLPLPTLRKANTKVLLGGAGRG